MDSDSDSDRGSLISRNMHSILIGRTEYITVTISV